MAAPGSSAASTVGPSGTESDFAPSELPLSDAGDTDGASSPVAAPRATFPPYPPYATALAPPSVKDAIHAGREMRVQHKSVIKRSMRPTPKPAKPKGPKATDVRMSRRETRAYARCLRRHGAVLTDRLERMARPQRRTILYLWREHAHTLPEDTINRLRTMLDADEPFKPDQAYEYFVNLRKTKKKAAQMRGANQVKKDLLAVCGDKRFVWARNATVAFARGIQQRLRKPGRYALADAMLRLSDIVLDEICSYMDIRKPSRSCCHPKARFMMEMADKVAVWIDEILAESDDRMLMMDFDEDDDVVQVSMGGGDDDFADDFLNMMGGVDRPGAPSVPRRAFKELSPEDLAKLTPEERSKYEDERRRKLGSFVELTPEQLAQLTPEELAKYEAEKRRRMDGRGAFPVLTPDELAKVTPEERAKYEAEKRRKSSSFVELTPEQLAKLTPEERAKYEAENRRRMNKGGAFKELTPGELAKLTPEERAKDEAEKRRKLGSFVELTPEQLAKLTPEERAKYEAEKRRRMDGGGASRELTSDELAKPTPEERAKYETEKRRKLGSFVELTPEQLAKLTPEERAKYEAEKHRRMDGGGASRELTPDELAKPTPEERAKYETENRRKLGSFVELTPEQLAKLTPEERAKYEAEKLRRIKGSGESKERTLKEMAKVTPAESAKNEAAKKGEEQPRKIEGGGVLGDLTTEKLAKLTPEDRAKYGAEKKRAEELSKKGGALKEQTPEVLAKLTPEERAKYEAEKMRRFGAGKLDDSAAMNAERADAYKILHGQLRARGGEVFYSQPPTVVTHAQASESLSTGPSVQRTVRDSADTGRLAKKFEKKLGALVSGVTPPRLNDAMEDVVIESSRRLSELFVSKNYKTLAKEALISEMQRKGNELLIELDGAAETYFFAAQRLKLSDKLEAKEPCTQVAYHLTKELNDMMRCRVMPRKLTSTVKEHVKEAADYLSGVVTKPDEKIEAYVALLGEMEAAGDNNLIEGNITKTYKDAAAYLRQLTTFKDEIGRGDSAMQASVESKLKGLVANVAAGGYSPSAMAGVISETTRLLVSYIKLQGEKTDALQVMIAQMDGAGDTALLRHGTVRKSYADGADLLKGKNIDQMKVQGVDPVVTRKIQIKLANLMLGHTPDKFKALMDDVVQDATNYLAFALLQPQVIKVCKCMKNVFVQCELWCEEILRRVGRPCCACPRHASARALAELAGAPRLRLSPGSSRAFAPGLELALRDCPRARRAAAACPAPAPSPACPGPQRATASYMLYETRHDPPQTPADSLCTTYIRSPLSSSLFYPKPQFEKESVQIPEKHSPSKGSPDIESTSTSSSQSFYTPESTISSNNMTARPYGRTHTTMYSSIDYEEPQRAPVEAPAPAAEATSARRAETHTSQASTKQHVSEPVSEPVSPLPSQGRAAYSCRAPIVSTNEMSDWHAMMVSLIWNVQAWRDWIKENIDKALAYRHDDNTSQVERDESWAKFQRIVTVEALQWRQYNTFSKQLTQRLVEKYKDKKIVSPTRATVRTDAYNKCQQEMLKIIEMFNKWTHWLMVVVKETDSLKTSSADIPLHELRWNHFKRKIASNAEDWDRYDVHLKVCWQDKYRVLLSEWLPMWRWSGPVWVVSACGAVPSGAVAAGVCDGEVVWVARTTHRCNVLPAALQPSKHCCLVYADGAVHYYNKYQVMCNAEVRWVACRAGAAGARAVRVAAGVHVGRVRHRGAHLVGAVRAPHHCCHVVISGRPFAFNCYELLVLADTTPTATTGVTTD